jgi:hypothetical protein
MPTPNINKDKNRSDSTRISLNTTLATPRPTTRTETRRKGTTMVPEDQQDIKDPLEGRKFLEKHFLLCPPGEPPTNSSLAACLYQISVMAGLQKPVINAVRAVAFLLEEIEDDHINLTVKEAFDSQINEFTNDMKDLIEDAKEKINTHIKTTEERFAKIIIPTPVTQQNAATPFTTTNTTTATYATALINPPPHANPKIAAKEGIKARQFMIEGINKSKLNHLDLFQLKTELNRTFANLGLAQGKIRSVINTKNSDTLIEMDSDEATAWLTANKTRICNEIGPEIKFRTRIYNVIAFNVPLGINPDERGHLQEIGEVNNVEPDIIMSAKWAKPINRRTPEQRTAHLIITFSNADAANRAITNGLNICNRRCRTEKIKREPIRCLKCQGWNHFAKECPSTEDKCGNCTGAHRTNTCTTPNNRKCASCNSNDHASWCRTCPTFIKKQEDFNVRNPDNSLQYFPSADSWTWTTNDKPQATLPPKITAPTAPPRSNPNPTQRQNNYGQVRRLADTYIPNYSNQHSRPETSQGWNDPTGLNEWRPLLAQQVVAAINNHENRTTNNTTNHTQNA